MNSKELTFSCEVLKSIYSNVMSLPEYIALISQRQLSVIIPEEDNDSFIKYAKSLFIVPEDKLKMVQSFQNDPANIIDILREVVAQKVRNNSESNPSADVLIQGYRKKRRDNGSHMRGNVDIDSYFINTIHNYYNDDAWQKIADRVGEAFTRRLLDRPLFKAVDNGCFVQIAGQAAADYIRQIRKEKIRFTHDRNCLKRSRTPLIYGDLNSFQASSYPVTMTDFQRSYNESIPRYKLFYQRQYQKLPGLPKRSIFNRRNNADVELITEIFCKINKPEYRVASCGEKLNLGYCSVSVPESQRLVTMCRAVIDNFQQCNIPNLLFYHCPEHQTQPQPLVMKDRKLKSRGSRGGLKKNKPKNESGSVSSSTSSSRATLLSQFSTITAPPTLHAPPMSLRRAHVTTVSNRLLSRLVRNVVTDSYVSDNGILTQDISEVHFSDHFSDKKVFYDQEEHLHGSLRTPADCVYEYAHPSLSLQSDHSSLHVHEPSSCSADFDVSDSNAWLNISADLACIGVNEIPPAKTACGTVSSEWMFSAEDTQNSGFDFHINSRGLPTECSQKSSAFTKDLKSKPTLMLTSTGMLTTLEELIN